MSIQIDWNIINEFAREYYSLPEDIIVEDQVISVRDEYITNLYNSLDTIEQKNQFLEEITIIKDAWNIFGRPKQQLFEKIKDGYKTIAYIGGRGVGKSLAASMVIRDCIYNNLVDPRHDILVFGPTVDDCRKIMFDGDSGIFNIFPKEHKPVIDSKNCITFHNGNRCYMLTSQDANKARGSNSGLIILDEVAAYEQNQLQALYTNARASLRKNPAITIITSTPRSSGVYGMFFKELYLQSLNPNSKTCIIQSSSKENIDNLVDLDMRYEENKDTQSIIDEEYNGEFLFENIEMMFIEKNIRNNIILEEENCNLYAIGLDVAVKTTKKSDETGIILAGKKANGQCIILEDKTGTHTPDNMAKNVLELWIKYRHQPYILIETNQGGDYIKSALHAYAAKLGISPQSLNMKIKEFHATDSKSSRAYEPSILVKQNEIKFWNQNNKLEPLIRQLSRFTGFDNTHAADDRVDAFTSTINFLRPKKGGNIVSSNFGF